MIQSYEVLCYLSMIMLISKFIYYEEKIFGLIVAFAVIAIAATANYVYNKKAEMALDAALANIEALATGEEVAGAVCFYKGNSNYERRIPCTADFPNIGSCGDPVWGFYSDDKAQCIK